MKRLILLIIGLVILFSISGCKMSAVELKQGEKMIEIIKNNLILLQETHKISESSYVGTTLGEYVMKFYHDDFQLLDRSKIIYDSEGQVVSGLDCEELKNARIIPFAKHEVKDAPLYIQIPGEILYIIGSDTEMKFELIGPSIVKIIEWQNESSADLVYLTSEYDQMKMDDLNYVLYDYTMIQDQIYQEIISINLEEFGDIVMTVDEWLEQKDFNNYDELQKHYQFKQVIKQNVISATDLEKKKNDHITFLGEINANTYIRLPKDILYVSDNVKYEIIDKKTILVKSGLVTLIYK